MSLAMFCLRVLFQNLKISTLGHNFLGNSARNVLRIRFPSIVQSPCQRERGGTLFHSTPDCPTQLGTIVKATLMKKLFFFSPRLGNFSRLFLSILFSLMIYNWYIKVFPSIVTPYLTKTLGWMCSRDHGGTFMCQKFVFFSKYRTVLMGGQWVNISYGLKLIGFELQMILGTSWPICKGLRSTTNNFSTST